MKILRSLKRLIFDDVQGFEACRRVEFEKEVKQPEDTEVRMLVEKGKNDFKCTDAK